MINFPELNKQEFLKFLSIFFKKLTQDRKDLVIVSEDNIYSIVNENGDIIEDKVEVKVNQYGVFIDVNGFNNGQDDYKLVFRDLGKQLQRDGEKIFGKKLKTFGYFQGNLFFLFNDIFFYEIYAEFNRRLNWNDLVYGIDLETLQLFVKKEDEVKHNAVFAITRSGKTVLLQNILFSTLDRDIYNQYPNLRPEILIIEKSMDFDDVVPFKGITYKGSLEGGDVIDFKDILQMFFFVELQYKYRKNIFKQAGAQKLQDYNAMVEKEKQMGIFFVVIDEFQSVLKKFEGNKENYKFLVDKVAKITAVYTDSGIYLYGGTQLYGSEKGIPSNIAGNIETKVFGRYTTDTDLYNSNIKDTYITTKNIAKGDFLWTQGTDIRLIRAPLPYSLNLIDKIEEAKQNNDIELLKNLNVLKYKEIKSKLPNFKLKEGIETNQDIQDTIFNANSYMKGYLTNKIEDMLFKINDNIVEKWLGRTYLEEHGIDVNEIEGMERFSFIVIMNIIKDYINEVKEMVQDGQTPIELDFKNYKKRLSDAVDLLGYPLVLAEWIWENYFQKLWKTNIDKNLIKKIEKILEAEINEAIGGVAGLDEEDIMNENINGPYSMSMLDTLENTTIKIYERAMKTFIKDRS